MADLYADLLAKLQAIEQSRNAWPVHDFQAQADEKMAQTPVERSQQYHRDLRATNAGTAYGKNELHPYVRATKSRVTAQAVRAIAEHNPHKVNRKTVPLSTLNARPVTFWGDLGRVDGILRYDRVLQMWEIRGPGEKMRAAFYGHTVEARFNAQNHPEITIRKKYRR